MTNDKLINELGIYLVTNSKFSYDIEITELNDKQLAVRTKSFDQFYVDLLVEKRDLEASHFVDILGNRILKKFEWIRNKYNA